MTRCRVEDAVVAGFGAGRSHGIGSGRRTGGGSSVTSGDSSSSIDRSLDRFPGLWITSGAGGGNWWADF
jgi:hypothetical protein